MNRSDLSKVVGAGVLSLSLTIVPLSLPAFAQNNAESNAYLRHYPFQKLRMIIIIGLARFARSSGLANLFHKETTVYRPNADWL